MSGFGRELWLSRWVVVREWLIGALTALVMIAVWALVVWLAVTVANASGLLPPSIRS